MSMIFRFRMLSDENDNFYRDYEVPYDLSLPDFHKFICNDLKYDCGSITSFFLADEHWNKLREFTLADMGFDGGESDTAPVPMDGVELSQIIRDNFDRLIYQFDMFGDRIYFLQLIEAKKREPGAEYPALTHAHGDIPGQFGDGAAAGSSFDEIMAEFNDFEGDENYDDE